MTDADAEEVKKWFRENVPLYSDCRIKDSLDEVGAVEIELDVRTGCAGAFVPGCPEDEEHKPTDARAMKRRNNEKGDGCVIVTMEADEDAAESGHVGVMIPRKHPLFLSSLLTLYFPSLCPLWAPENRAAWSGVEMPRPSGAESDSGEEWEDLAARREQKAKASAEAGASGQKRGRARNSSGMTFREFAMNTLLRGGPETEWTGETRFRMGWRGTEKVIALMASILEDEYLEYHKFQVQQHPSKGKGKGKKGAPAAPTAAPAAGGANAPDNLRQGSYVPEDFAGSIADYKNSYIDAMTYTMRHDGVGQWVSVSAYSRRHTLL